jgi:chromosome segregation ATPase
MTPEHDMLLGSVNDKIQQLVLRYERTKAECNKLRVALEERDARIEGLEVWVHKLEEKNKKLQLVDAFKASSEDTRDAKLKIGRIVREIDKCMNLLN